ncbi:MAG: DUF6799 domain-containing protein [Bacteroidia bacterium]
MKKLFALITVCLLAAGIATAQESAKKAEPATIAVQKQAPAVIPMCDMKNFYCMRAGRMTTIKEADDIGMNTEMVQLPNGATLKKDGTFSDAKGKTVAFKEGDCVDFNGERCTLIQQVPDAPTPPVEVK